MKENILFLLGTYPGYGGVEKVTTVLANEFYKRGYGVSIVSFEQPHPELGEQELSPNIKLYQLDYPVCTAKNIRLLKQIVKEDRIRFLINQWCVPFYVSRLIRRAVRYLDCRVIAVHHNLPTSNTRIKELEFKLQNTSVYSAFFRAGLAAVKFFSRLSLRYTYERSDAFVVLSKRYVEPIGSYIFKKKPHKIYTITNPLTVKRDDKDIPSKEKEIIYVGRIDFVQKRVFRMVDIWQEIEDLYPDWNFTMVGDGPNKDELLELIQKRHVKRFKITGFTNPIPYYQKASVLLLMSEYEGFGLVITEGMSYGVVPIVYGSYDAVYDIIDSGKNGYVTSVPYSPDEMVARLRGLMDDDKLLKEMSDNVRRLDSKFAVDKIIGQWEDLLGTL